MPSGLKTECSRKTSLWLATVLADHISHAYLFNSPGGGGHSGPFAMVYAILDFLEVAPAYDQSKISNIEAATGSKPIAGLDFDVAPPIDIIIEDQMASDISNPPGACDHSQQVLTTNSFSRLYRLFPICSQPESGTT